jgi:hypothetical protein
MRELIPLYPSNSRGGALPNFSNKLLGGGSSSADFTAERKYTDNELDKSRKSSVNYGDYQLIMEIIN